MTAVAATGALLEVGAGTSGPPTKMRTNETPTWQDVPFTDRFGNEYDSGVFARAYVFAGASAAPVTVASVAAAVGLSSMGWQTTFSAAAAALMLAGQYWWQSILTVAAGKTLPPNFPPITQIIAGEGEIVVEPDLSKLTGTFDGRSVYEIGLANCESALIVFQASGGRVKAYEIAGRRMVFADTKEIKDLADWFRGRINSEAAEASGGDSRHIHVAFRQPRSGIPTAQAWPWPWG